MSKSLGQFWGFESSLTSRGNQFGLLQVNVSMRIPTTSLPGISNTTPVTPSQSTSVVTITLRPDGFTVSLPHAPQHQGPIQTGVFGPRPTVANDNAQSTPATVELPVAAAAAMGELQVGHDLYAALGEMFRATPANTNSQAPQQTQPSQSTAQAPHIPTHQPVSSQAPAASTHLTTPHHSLHTPTTSAHPTVPATTTPTSQAPQSTATVRPERSLEQSFTLLVRPKNEEIKSSGRNLVGEFHQELSQKAPAEIGRALKEQGFPSPPQKVIAEAVQKLVTQLRSETPNLKDISPNKQVTDILLRVAREIIRPKADLAAKGKDSFGSNDRLAVYRQTFGQTSRSVAFPAGPRVWGQQLPAQNYPQAFQQLASHGPQTPTTSLPQGMNGGSLQTAAQMLGNFGTASKAPGQQTQTQANPLNPQFALATSTQHLQPQSSNSILSPSGVPYTANDTDLLPGTFQAENNNAFGDSRDGQSQPQQRGYHNGINIEQLKGPDGRLRTLNLEEALAVIKYFFRTAGQLNLLDKMYDMQDILNPQAGPFNAFLFRAATTQEIYNQMAMLSNGQIMQNLIQEMRLTKPADPFPSISSNHSQPTQASHAA